MPDSGREDSHGTVMDWRFRIEKVALELCDLWTLSLSTFHGHGELVIIFRASNLMGLFQQGNG